jgi:hypothetical protein
VSTPYGTASVHWGWSQTNVHASVYTTPSKHQPVAGKYQSNNLNIPTSPPRQLRAIACCHGCQILWSSTVTTQPCTYFYLETRYDVVLFAKKAAKTGATFSTSCYFFFGGFSFALHKRRGCTRPHSVHESLPLSQREEDRGCEGAGNSTRDGACTNLRRCGAWRVTDGCSCTLA